MEKNDFTAWLEIFGRWLKGQEKKPSQPIISEERWIEEDNGRRILECRLSLLRDDDNRFVRPGAIATWNLINYQAPQGGLLITLDNLFRLQSQLNPSNPKADLIRKGLHRSLGLTHRFQVTWLFKRDKDSPLRFILISALDLDLASQYIDESAKEVVRYVALEAFNMRHVPALPWRERLQQFPWYETIAQIAPRKGCPHNPRVRVLCRRAQKVSMM